MSQLFTSGGQSVGASASASVLPEYSGLISFKTDWFDFLPFASVQFSSVTQSCLTVCDPMNRSRPGLPVHHPHPEPTLSWWCHPTISSSVIPFSSHLQSFQATGSFQMSQIFGSGGLSTGFSASTSVLPINIQDWFPLGWTGWISLQSKGLSRVFSNPTVQKHQFFSAQLPL